jgi:hypothetical protein
MKIEEKIFYRFATFEIPKYSKDKMVSCDILNPSDIYTNVTFSSLLDYCRGHTNKRLCNPGCFVENPNPVELSQKSGDIMLLDRDSFLMIKGWPENGCFVHMDMATCIVATNNFPFIVAPIDVCIYTFTQDIHESSKKNVIVEFEGNKYTLEDYQFMIAKTYFRKKKCNK